MLKLHANVHDIFSLTQKATINFEEECYIHHTARVLGYLKIGAFSYIGYNCLIGASTIGRFCSVAPGVSIGLGEHDTTLFSTHPIFYGSKHGYDIPDGIGVPRSQIPPLTIIGDDVWIGTNAIILRGVKIGKGAVVAANAVVVKDVPPYSIVGGVPAKTIKKRFESSIIEKLTNLDWTSLNLSCFIGCDVRETQISSLIDYIQKALTDKKNIANYKLGVVKKENGEII